MIYTDDNHLHRAPARRVGRPSASATRFTLIQVRNDDGHVTGIERFDTWLALGEVATVVIERLTEELGG